MKNLLERGIVLDLEEHTHVSEILRKSGHKTNIFLWQWMQHKEIPSKSRAHYRLELELAGIHCVQ
jgi:hypothetical protein